MYLSVQTITTKRFTGGCALAEYLGTYVLNECEKKNGGTVCNWVPFCIENAIRVALTRVRIILSRRIKNLDLKNATNFCLRVLSENWLHF